MTVPGKQQSDSAQPALRLGFLLLPEFTLSAFSLCLDPFRIAADKKDFSRQIRCRWRVLSPNGLPVRSSCGVDIYPTAKTPDFANLDWLFVVGGLIHQPYRPNDRTLDLLRDAARAGVRVMGICTGVFSMAEAGLLDGETACVSWFHREEFLEAYDTVAVDTSGLYRFGQQHATCAGGLGSIHAALDIIGQTLGKELAIKAARILMMPRYWERDSTQPVVRGYEVASPTVREALRYMELNLETSPRMGEVADAVGVSERQLERLFKKNVGKSPQRVMSALKLEKARSYIEDTGWSILDISYACGFANPSQFSAKFKQAYGVTPTAYRHSLSALPTPD